MPRRTRLDEAADPTTPAARLRQLATARSSPALRAAVAANPNAPVELLIELAKDHPAAVLANPSLALALLLDPALLLRAPWPVQEALASTPGLSTTLQEQLLRSSETVRRALLHNPDLTPGIVQSLSVDLEAFTRQEAAHHPLLAPDWYALLRRAGADEGLGGRRPEQATELDEGEWQRLLAAGRWAHELIAAHPGLPPWVMTALAGHAEPDPSGFYALQLLAQRPDLPEPVALTLLERFTFGSLWDHLAIAQPLDRHPRVLDRLDAISRQRPTRVRQGFASNPSTPLRVLRELLEDIRLAPLVIRNPSLPPREIESLASKPGWAMRQIAAGSDRLSPATLARLAGDMDERVRMVVARNIHTPLAALEALCDDDAAVVRERARELCRELRPADS